MQEKTEQWYNLSDAVVRRLSNGDLEYLSADYVTEIESQLSTLRTKARLCDEIVPWLRLNNIGPDHTPRFSGWLARYDALTEPVIQGEGHE